MFLKSLFFVSSVAVLGFASMGFVGAAAAQAAPPAAPVPQPGAAALAAPGDPFPPVNLKYFTADSPSTATVESFLHALWGYDTNRIWRVEGIEKTASPGVSKVVVYLSEKGAANARMQSTGFWVMADGKHAIADTMIDFGAAPYAAKRKMLEERANGPALGSASKELLLVEFSDLQCPHCKDAESNMAQLAKDFPTARIVHQPFPLVGVHPAAALAAAEGLCVAKASNSAYFTYEEAVYATQEALTPEGTKKTLDAAVAKAGQDPAAIAACAATPAIKDAVNASIKLAEDAGVDQTPTIAVNGRLLPASPAAMSYETLKKIILFQAELDGVHVDPPQPTLSTLGK